MAAGYTLSTNMSLRKIAERNTSWFANWLQNFTIIDTHDHSSGKGVQVPTGGIANGAITNAKVNASAAIDGTKVSPTFGTQNLRTSGTWTFDGTNGFKYDSSKLQYQEGGTGWNDVAAVVSPSTAQVPPVGSIIPFYDFDGGLTFNTTYWAYCNGQTKTIGETSRTLPDLSGRYLVGFGTDGDGLMGSATWSASAVGNAAHEVTLSAAQSGLVEHTHANSVGNQSANHTHSGTSSGVSANHTHALSSGSASSSCSVVCRDGGVDAKYPGFIQWVDNDATIASTVSITVSTSLSGNTGNESADHTHTLTTGNQNADHNHTVTISNVSSAAASTAHSIQPRSIRVRFIMRIA